MSRSQERCSNKEPALTIRVLVIASSLQGLCFVVESRKANLGNQTGKLELCTRTVHSLPLADGYLKLTMVSLQWICGVRADSVWLTMHSHLYAQGLWVS